MTIFSQLQTPVYILRDLSEDKSHEIFHYQQVFEHLRELKLSLWSQGPTLKPKGTSGPCSLKDSLILTIDKLNSLNIRHHHTKRRELHMIEFGWCAVVHIHILMWHWISITKTKCNSIKVQPAHNIFHNL